MNEEEDLEELFEKGEMIVLTLKDGRHYFGEFMWVAEDGVALKLEAKTAYRTMKVEDSKFEQFVVAKITEELNQLYTPNDWLQKALGFASLDGSDPNSIRALNSTQLRGYVRGRISEIHRKWAREHWQGPIQEQDVSVPYLKDLKRSIRTLVTWGKIDEICSATEMAEEAQVADFNNLLDNEDFMNLFEGMQNDD